MKKWATLGIFRKWLASQSPDTNLFQLQSPILLRSILNYMLVNYSTALDKPRHPFPSDNEVRLYLAENRGYMEMPNPLTSAYVPNDTKVDFTPQFAPDNSDNLRRIFDISRKYNFQIFIVFNPIFVRQETEKTVEAFSKIKDRIMEAASSYSNVYVEDEPVRFYPDHLLTSVTHLYIDGATKNTKELIPVMLDIINKHD